MKLSDHFSLEELTFSEKALRLGLTNVPSDWDVANMTRLAEVLLEPSRSLLDVPLYILSGYRCPVLNHDIGGAVDSAHTYGCAADIRPIGFPIRDAFDALRLSQLPYDQIIFECEAWIHLAQARPGFTPRRQALLASGSPGNWKYEVVT